MLEARQSDRSNLVVDYINLHTPILADDFSLLGNSPALPPFHAGDRSATTHSSFLIF
jgi:hypothetical protein